MQLEIRRYMKSGNYTYNVWDLSQAGEAYDRLGAVVVMVPSFTAHDITPIKNALRDGETKSFRFGTMEIITNRWGATS